MVKLPFGVDIKNLIADLRIISWEASEKLLYYSQILKDTNYKSNIIENENPEDPVTKADLEVNDLIIKRIKEKYHNTPWNILSEEKTQKEDSTALIQNLIGIGYLIHLMEQRILFKELKIMQCIYRLTIKIPHHRGGFNS